MGVVRLVCGFDPQNSGSLLKDYTQSSMYNPSWPKKCCT